MTIKLISQCEGGEHLVVDVDGRKVAMTRTELFALQAGDQSVKDVEAIKLAVAGKDEQTALAELAVGVDAKVDVIVDAGLGLKP